jgi:hypothetical protein
VTTAAKSAPRRRSWRKTLAGCTAILVLGAAATRQYLIAVPVLIAALAAGTLFLRARWARYRSGGWIAARRRRKHQGWAGPADLLRARRAAARLTRRICPGAGLLVLGTVRRQQAAVCRENSALYVGPPGYGKTAALACHAADAPGALFASSTKTDLLLDTIGSRELKGRIWVLNPDGHGGIPTTLRWSPVDGCQDATTALRRAGDFAAAAPKDGKKDADYWTAKGAGLIAVMLHAAAITPGATMRQVAAWVRDPWTQAVQEIYALPHADPVLGHKLASLLSGEGEHLNGIIGAAESALAWMDDPAMDAIACPPPGEGFDPVAFARSHDSAYLVTRKRPFGSAAPYCAALGAEVFEQLRACALESQSGRLPVPATYVLDEMPLTCPVPVHDMLADARGYLITITMGAQSWSQLRSVWGPDNADTIRSASPVEVILGGEKQLTALVETAGVIGNRDTWHGSPDDLRAEPLMPPGALRRLRKGKAVILMPECRPVLASLPAIWKRPGHERATLADFPVALPVPQPALESGRREAIPMPPVRSAVTEPAPAPALTAEEVTSWPVPASR